MRATFKVLFLASAIASLFGSVVIAADNTNSAGVSFTFLYPPITPTRELVMDAYRVKDTDNGKDHGAISNVITVHIDSITITWADTNRFKSNKETENTLRHLLAASDGHTFDAAFFEQPLSLPVLAAKVKHADGKNGQLLLFYGLFAYQDHIGWWWDNWQNKY